MVTYGLSGRVVVVTGGASGIGLSTVQALVRDGASVAILDLQRDKVDETVALSRDIAPDGVRILGLTVDVQIKEDLARAASRIETELGPVSGLIASAGISGSCRSEDLPVDELNRIMSVNVTGTLLTCQAFVRGMFDRKCGSIVVVGSVASLGGQPGRLAYNASKHAVAGVVKTLAVEWGARGVRINAVAPGPVDTPLVQRGVPPSYFRNVYCDRTPLGRLARPDEIASVTLMLLSDASSFVHGVVVPVDGGLMAGPFTRNQGADMGSISLLEAGIYTE